MFDVMRRVALALLLLGAPTLWGCMRGGFDPLASPPLDGRPTEGNISDTGPGADLTKDLTEDFATDVNDDAPRPLGPFGTPQLIAEFVDPLIGCDDPTLTRDGLEIFFNKGDTTGMWIFKSDRLSVSDAWSPPSEVTELNTGDESNPAVSPDGLTLYFARRLPWNILVATRANRGATWSAPSLLPQLNSSDSDLVASVDGSDLFLWIHSDRFETYNVHDLLLSTRLASTDPWGAPVPVVELNSTSSEHSGWSNAGATVLYFVSDRAGGAGGSDIYRSQRVDSSADFDPPVAVDELNSIDAEDDPWLSDDQRTIYFASDRSGVLQLYQALR